MQRHKKPNFLKLAKDAANIIDDKKGSRITIVNVKKLTTLADYFLIATVESPPQLNAVISAVKKAFINSEAPLSHAEGIHSYQWAVLDYGGLVIHIMQEEARNFYALDNIWADGKKIRKWKK
jgi:ribosome-associated protein